MKRASKLIFMAVIAAILVFSTAGVSFAIRAQAVKLTDDGFELFKLNKLAEAESKFKSAIDEDGSYDKPYFYMAQICERNGNHDEAINFVKKALRNSPHEETYKAFLCDINNNMAAEAIKNSNPDRATKLYFANIEALPFHIPTYNRIAAFYLSKGDFNKALLYCNKALENSSSIPPSLRFDSGETAMLHACMAACFYELKNYSRAIAEIDIARKTKDTPFVQKYVKKIMSEENPVFAELKKAEAAYASGNLEAAKQGFEKVLEMYPSCAPALEKITLIDKKKKVDEILAEAKKFESAGQLADAIDKYSEVLAVEPQREDLRSTIKSIEERMSKQQQDALASMKRKKTAVGTDGVDLVDKSLKALVEKDQASNDPNKLYETRFKEAEELFNKQNYEEALIKYKSIIEDKEDFRNDEIKKRIRAIHAAQGEFYIESADYAIPKVYIYIILALVILVVIYVQAGDQIAAIFRQDPYKFLKRGVEYIEKEKYESAIQSFEKALATIMEPIERTKVKTKMSLCFFKMKDYDRCIKVSTEVLDVDPKNEAIHGYLANSFLEKNAMTERAITEYKLLLRKQKDDKRLLTVLCTHYINEDNLSSEAIEVYQKVFQIDPKDKRVRKMLCEAFIRGNDKTDLAVKVYESVLEDEPNRKDAKLMLISAQFQRKNFEDCIRLCREIFNTGGIENITLEYYTNSFSKLNRKGELYDEYKKLSEKFPDNQTLKSYLEKIQSLLAVERLTNRNIDTSKPTYESATTYQQPQQEPDTQAAQAQEAPRPRVAAVNICKSCAHMNPGTMTVCEKCGAQM